MNYNHTMTEDSTAQVAEQYKPSGAFVGVSWMALGLGIFSFIVGLWNASSTSMTLSEKGYYFTVLMYGLFSAICVQKSVRDRLENIPVSDMFYGISWFSVILTILLLIIGLWNSEQLLLSEKGFYGISFVLGLFGAIAVQKNVRDLLAYENHVPKGLRKQSKSFLNKDSDKHAADVDKS